MVCPRYAAILVLTRQLHGWRNDGVIASLKTREFFNKICVGGITIPK